MLGGVLEMRQPSVDFLEQGGQADKAGARAAVLGHDAPMQAPAPMWGRGQEREMFALLRLSVIGFVVLTVIYVSLSFYSRAVRRGKLEAEWDEEGMTGDREAFIDEGLREYDHSLRRKLILGVYIVPVTLVILLIYFVNFY